MPKNHTLKDKSKDHKNQTSKDEKPFYKKIKIKIKNKKLKVKI